jgi:hypothetical protein
MTDRDEIELPPLPPFGIAPIADEQTVRDYARAAVLADRKRRAEQAQPAKPKVHSVALSLGPDNSWSCYAWAVHPALATVTLSWTDDGRAWIDNKRNRELAKWLRMWQGATGNEAADALDGGVR